MQSAGPRSWIIAAVLVAAALWAREESAGATPQVEAGVPTLPPAGAIWRSTPADEAVSYGSGSQQIAATDARLGGFANTREVKSGDDALISFDATLSADIQSMASATPPFRWNVAMPGSMTVRLAGRGRSETGRFRAEVTEMSFTAWVAPSEGAASALLSLRQSPAKKSLGTVTVRRTRDGRFSISSTLTVWSELTFHDQETGLPGAWLPDTEGPLAFVMAPEPPPPPEPVSRVVSESPGLPPRLGAFGSDPRSSEVDFGAVVATDVSLHDVRDVRSEDIGADANLTFGATLSARLVSMMGIRLPGTAWIDAEGEMSVRLTGAAGQTLGTYPLTVTDFLFTAWQGAQGGTRRALLAVRQSPVSASTGSITVAARPGGGFTMTSDLLVHSELAMMNSHGEPGTWVADALAPHPYVLRQFAVTPDGASVGTVVLLSGADFGSRRGSVRIGGAPAKVIEWSRDLVRLHLMRMPKIGPADVEIRPKGAPRLVWAASLDLRAPEIRSIEPASGPPGTEVTLRGRWFGAAKGRLMVGGLYVRPSTWTMDRDSSECSATFRVPAQAAPGPADVTIRTRDAALVVEDGFTVE